MKHILASLALSTVAVVGTASFETSGLLGEAKQARAEDVKAKRSASVMASPGESARVVTRVRAGTKMAVLDRKGRWLKVRVGGRTGWITQSSVSRSQARAPVRKTRRRAFVGGRSRDRSKKRRGAPSDRVGADALDEDDFDDDDAFEDEDEAFEDDDFEDEDEDFEDDDFDEDEDGDEASPDSVVALANTKIRRKPSGKARAAGRARKGARLLVIARKGDWIKVENGDGDVGWVRSKDVDDNSFKYSKYNIRYHGGLGYTAFSQAFATPNDCFLCNYSLASGAIAANVGADFIYDYSKEYLVAADLAYRYTKASPGIRFVNEQGTPADISFQAHRIDVGARFGYKIGKSTGMAAYARAGYHYDRFGIDNVENFDQNLAKLPSEILSGFTVGAMLDVPRFNPKIAFRIGADILLSGTRQQTAGLEDGLLSTASAIWATARLDYQWKPTTKLSGQYYYTGATTEWVGQAMDSLRDHQAESAKREDVSHALFIALSRAL